MKTDDLACGGAAAMIFTLGTLCPPQALAQVPARFYWKDAVARMRCR